MADFKVFRGDVWEAFDADPRSVLLHGATSKRPAKSGFAATVVARVGERAIEAHYDSDLGEVCWLTPRIAVGVTQPAYYKANASLIVEAVARAGVRTFAGASVLLVPLIGGGLGSLSMAESMDAIKQGALLSDLPVHLYLLPPPKAAA